MIGCGLHQFTAITLGCGLIQFTAITIGCGLIQYTTITICCGLIQLTYNCCKSVGWKEGRSEDFITLCYFCLQHPLFIGLAVDMFYFGADG